MLIKNKKTGEIGEVGYLATSDGTIMVNNINDQDELYEYNSLAELNEEWEDVPQEPKKHYEILAMGAVMEREDAEDEIFRNQGQREIGNYFSSREEAELAVRKLKAWKRLKDKGFKFQGWEDLEAIELPIKHYNNIIGFRLEDNHDVIVDLNTIFGGEE